MTSWMAVSGVSRGLTKSVAPSCPASSNFEGLMSTDVITATPDQSVVEVLRLMTDGRFRHMPVLEQEQLVGMITIGDVVNFRLTALEYEALQLKQLIVG